MSKYYTKTHECLDVNGNVATLSISNYAITELGDIVYVELPDVGREVKSGESIITVESVKAASDVYSPISGKVIEVNAEASDDTSLINDVDSEDSWLIKIEMSDASECESLLSEDEYTKHIS